MNCRSCDPQGLVIMKRSEDNAKFVFKCSCGKSNLDYPFWSHTFTGYVSWMTSKDMGTSLEEFKKNNLRLIENSPILRDMDVGREVEILKQEPIPMRPVDFPEKEFDLVPF